MSSKKLTGNGLWESSRMMLPQHKERIIQHNQRLNVREKPLLHEDEWDLIIQNINLSLKFKDEVVVEIFEEYENRLVIGVISSVSQHSRKMKVECYEGFEWVDFDEILSVKLKYGTLE